MDYVVEIRHGDGDWRPVHICGRSVAETNYRDLIFEMENQVTGVRLVNHQGNVLKEHTG